MDYPKDHNDIPKDEDAKCAEDTKHYYEKAVTGIGGFVRASRETPSLERTIREKLQKQKSDNLNKLHKLDSALDALNNNETIQKVFEILSLADLA